MDQNASGEPVLLTSLFLRIVRSPKDCLFMGNTYRRHRLTDGRLHQAHLQQAALKEFTREQPRQLRHSIVEEALEGTSLDSRSQTGCRGQRYGHQGGFR